MSEERPQGELCPLAALPDALLDTVLCFTGLSARGAVQLLAPVCPRWRDAVRRVLSSTTPFSTLLAVACSARNAVLVLRVSRGATAQVVLTLPRPAPSDGRGGWPTFVRHAPCAQLGASRLLVSQYGRGVSELLLVEQPGGGLALVGDARIAGTPRVAPEGHALLPGGRLFMASAESGALHECRTRSEVAGRGGPGGLGRGGGCGGGAPPPRLRLRLPELPGQANQLMLWAVAACPGGRALLVAAHSDAAPEDSGRYAAPTAAPTGGVLRVPVPNRSWQRQRWSWVVPRGALNRPSDVAYRADGAAAFVAAFAAAPGGGGGAHRRAVFAYAVVPAGRPGGRWAPLPGFDGATGVDGGRCGSGEVHPWGLAVCPATGNVFVTSHGGGAEGGGGAGSGGEEEEEEGAGGSCCVAELCGRTGRLLGRWAHPALVSAQPNSLAVL